MLALDRAILILQKRGYTVTPSGKSQYLIRSPRLDEPLVGDSLKVINLAAAISCGLLDWWNLKW